jgi:hypothetical protein
MRLFIFLMVIMVLSVETFGQTTENGFGPEDMKVETGKISGILVIVKGRVYCFAGTAGLPTFNKEDDVAMAGRLCGARLYAKAADVEEAKKNPSAPEVDSQMLHINGQVVHLLAFKKDGIFKYLATDDENNIIIIDMPTKDEDRKNVGWYPTRAESKVMNNDDVVYKHEFTRPNAPEEKKYLGVGDDPLIVKDKDGKEHKFYPLMLTDKEHLATFVSVKQSGG